MSALEDWPPAPILQTARLSLEPLRINHAQAMASVLEDPQLFAFTGGSPCTLDELRDRCQRQVSGWSHDRRERWLNWILRERATGQAIGTTQVTLTMKSGNQLNRSPRNPARLSVRVGRWPG